MDTDSIPDWLEISCLDLRDLRLNSVSGAVRVAGRRIPPQTDKAFNRGLLRLAQIPNL
jgi:hypothetical protein